MATTELEGKAHALYRFYDESDSLLYVGITCDLGRRLEKHKGEKAWWEDIRRIAVEPYTSRSAVLAAERMAITSESPLHNKRMNNAGDLVMVTDEPTSSGTDGIVGRHFHSWRELTPDDAHDVGTIRNGRRLEWQGHVLERVEIGLYLVELFSWLDGCPNGQQLVPIETMSYWTFYDNALEMQCGLGCRNNVGYGETRECGGECSHVTDCIGVGVACHSCADSYSIAVPIIWKSGKPDERATLSALNRARKKVYK